MSLFSRREKSKLKVVRLRPDAVLPKAGRCGDVGLDLTATSISLNPSKPFIEYGTGLAVEIEEGYFGLLCARSSVSGTGLSLANSVGIVDSNFRGEIKMRFYYDNDLVCDFYTIGERIGQLIVLPYPAVTVEEVNSLSSSERGKGGFGSSGR